MRTGHGSILPDIAGSRHPARRPVVAIADHAPTANAPSRSVSRRFSA